MTEAIEEKDKKKGEKRETNQFTKPKLLLIWRGRRMICKWLPILIYRDFQITVMKLSKLFLSKSNFALSTIRLMMMKMRMTMMTRQLGDC